MGEFRILTEEHIPESGRRSASGGCWKPSGGWLFRRELPFNRSMSEPFQWRSDSVAGRNPAKEQCDVRAD